MARTKPRKLWVVELWENKRWVHTEYGEQNRDNRPAMLRALQLARSSYPNEKYKLTTYVPLELTDRAKS